MSMILQRIAIVSTMLILTSACTRVPKGVEPVSDFDIQRYVGTWYEIARFDHSFERGMSNVTATYTLRADGGIDVINKGFKDDERKWEEATGRAYFVDENHKGHLKVSFFGPFYASYVIAKLDNEDYSYALVTGPNRDYLWVLSRSPTLSKDSYDHLLEYADSLGFDTNNLIKVEHST